MTTMAAPDAWQIDRPQEPPRRPVNLVINAALQPVMWPALVLASGSGLSELGKIEPLGAVMLVLVYGLGLWLLYDAVARRSLRATMLLTALFSVVTVIALTVAGLFVSSRITEPPGRRTFDSVFWFSLAYTAPSLWSAVTFRHWLSRVDFWERTRLDCHRCGYNLIGTLQSGRRECPECGAAIDSGRRARYRQKTNPRKP